MSLMTRLLFRASAAALPLLFGACATTKHPSATVAVPPVVRDVRVERIDKEFELDRGIRRVAIDNPWGEINVRGRDEREVGIHAVIQRLPPGYAKAGFRSHREGDTLRIEAVFDADAKTSPGRVDIAVYLPSELALALHTLDSRISAKKRIGAIEASTLSGGIEASSRGQLSLHTQSGQIRAMAIGARWQGASEITSDSGRIILLVPTFGDVALSAETGGLLTTKFGLSVHPGNNGTRWARARYGKGTSTLNVRSRTGEIVLEQLILMGDDRSDLEDDD